MLHQLPSPVIERGCPQWRLDYESVTRKTDHKALFKLVEVAEAAILTRREVLTLSADEFAERQQIEVVLAKLRHLKKEVLKFF
jgi:hypothetical protein